MATSGITHKLMKLKIISEVTKARAREARQATGKARGKLQR